MPQPVNQIDAFRALGFWFAKLLQQTLDEEGAANEKLNELAEGVVNPEALSEGEELATSGSPRR